VLLTKISQTYSGKCLTLKINYMHLPLFKSSSLPMNFTKLAVNRTMQLEMPSRRSKHSDTFWIQLCEKFNIAPARVVNLVIVNHFWRGREYIFPLHTCIAFALIEFYMGVVGLLWVAAYKRLKTIECPGSSPSSPHLHALGE